MLVRGNENNLAEDVLAAERVPAPSNKISTLPERVATIYYRHGLLCSTYPWWAILVSILIVLSSCYPLLSIPFPGNEPEEISVSQYGELISNNPASIYNYQTAWKFQQPSVYVQQVIVRAAVHPWNSELGLVDAFRGPLGEVFQIAREVLDFHSQTTNLTLRDVCFYVEGLSTSARSFQSLLPEYSCLVLSPGNFWRLDETVFRQDAAFLDTIFSHKNPVEVRSSIAEFLFGVSLKDSGLKKYPVKTRSRVLTYGVTLVLKSYSELFVKELQSRLLSQFPLHGDAETADWQRRPFIYIFYPKHFNYLELVPLFLVYTVLFLYVYFAVRKIDVVKSKVGMAFSALATVVASLGMSLGLCGWFGLRFSLQGRLLFPYLLVIVGLENILVLTRSVVSTPGHLDVKIRVAQGLSREGWNITKNLLTEVTILTVGFFTFVPAIQEFCLFAFVALLSDFILQMLFFSTVLSIDILRMELSDPQRHRRQLQAGQQYNHTVTAASERTATVGSFHRPHLRPRSHTMSKINPTTVVAPSYNNTPPLVRLPRRLKIIFFWARTRFFQRLFMVGFVVWMGVFVYSYVVVERFNTTNPAVTSNETLPEVECSSNCSLDRLAYINNTIITTTLSPPDPDLLRLQHPTIELWKRLSYRHWPDLLATYNFSLAGGSVCVLPSIRLSIPVSPQRLPELRNPKDVEYLSHSRWKSLANALDTLDVVDSEDSDFSRSRVGSGGGDTRDEEGPFVPKSPLEILLTALVAIPSVIFSLYVMVVLYRCICSRHYAEWRSNWWSSGGVTPQEYYSQVIAESMPLVLDGHRSPVECVATDGHVISSVCLSGQLRVWDVQTGECISYVDRYGFADSPRQPSSPRGSYSQDVGELSTSPLSYSCSPPLGFRIPRSPELSSRVTGSPVWCMQCFEGLVALGCANGQIELWAGNVLKCFYDDSSGVGVAKLKAVGDRLLAARLSGVLECFQIQVMPPANASPKEDSSPPVHADRFQWDAAFRLVRVCGTRAHQQPIIVLDSEGGRVVSGSQDHCVKVWRLDNLMGLFTLHGHCGPITALFIDSSCPSASGTGSQDGMLCLWDLGSGTCVYSLQAHDGSVVALTYASSYVISMGSDDKVCVWERFQGHLLHTLPMTRLCCGSLAMLTDRLLVTSRQGSLVVWDVRTGEAIRIVRLGDSDNSTFIRHLLVVGDSVICDYGNQLRIVAFPMVLSQKNE